MENQRMSESATVVDDVLVDVSVARKLLDEPLSVQQVDVPDFFSVSSRRIEGDIISERQYDS